jgi:hypothetical protein
VQITASCFIQSATTGFTASVLPYHNRVSRTEAFEGPEPDDGKRSRPVLRGPAPSNGGWLLGEAVQAYEKGQASFILVARKTTRLLAELQSACWQPSPRTDADQQCEFCYQPEGWGKAYRFIALRSHKGMLAHAWPPCAHKLSTPPLSGTCSHVTGLDSAHVWGSHCSIGPTLPRNAPNLPAETIKNA